GQRLVYWGLILTGVSGGGGVGVRSELFLLQLSNCYSSSDLFESQPALLFAFDLRYPAGNVVR
ncbi:hypothetical protein SLEP1_g49372, partial [Rubroshorea leprosula]